MEIHKRIRNALSRKEATLDLSGLSLKSIPMEIEQLLFLKELNLNNNQITDISSLEKLYNLTTINIADNQIQEVSPLSQLLSLRNLNISSNEIVDIKSISKLVNVEKLNLSENQIQDISPLKNLVNLKKLDISNNIISNIEDLLNLSNLNEINLSNNPISNPPTEILNQGIEAIRSYFESMYKQGVKRLSETKLIVLGDGASGKTSIIQRLLYGMFNNQEASTHGIQISNWIIDTKDEEIKLNIWDFGGQEIMHSTHQFFLTERSIYLLVVDSRRESNIESWLKLIQFFGGNSPIIVVLNKIDQNPSFDLNRRFLHIKYPSIAGFVRTSCKTDSGISELKHTIISIYQQVSFGDILISNSWFNVKEKISTIDKNYFSTEDYFLICKIEGINQKEEQELLLRLLNDLGVLINFDTPALQDFIITKPQWLTNAIYQIINSKYLYEGKGLINISSIKNILSNDLKEYPPHIFNFIIDVMSEFEIAHKLKNESILIPDLLAIAEPAIDFDVETSLKFLIAYSFLPKSIMPRLIIAMYNDVVEGECWRNGMHLRNKLFASEALVRADNIEKTIFIYVNGEQRRNYLSVIRNEIGRINSSYANLEFNQKVPIPTFENITVNYEHLLRLERHQIESFFPDGADKMFNVKTLLDGISINRDLPSEEEVKDILNKITAGKKSKKDE